MKLCVADKSTGSIVFDSIDGTSTWRYGFDVHDLRFTLAGDASEQNLHQRLLQNKNLLMAVQEFALFFLDTIQKRDNDLSQISSIINHNFVETCGVLQQSVNSLIGKIPPKLTHKEKENHIGKSSQKMSATVLGGKMLSIYKSASDIRTQISGLEILSGGYSLRQIEHNLYDLLENIFMPFEKNFAEKNITVLNETAEHDYKIYADYDTMNWVFYHIINNCIKYCRPGTELRIDYDPKTKRIQLSMQSLRLEEAQASRIFNLGERGTYAESFDFPGEGYGMYFVKICLERVGASIKFVPNNSIYRTLDDVPYGENEIHIYLPSTPVNV